MELFLMTGGVCALFFAMCYAGTGSDEKNLKSFSSYPDEVQAFVQDNPAWAGKIRKTSPVLTFVSNFILFGIVLFLCGLPVRGEGFWDNFIRLSILGQTLNLFDFLVIDLLWWRHSPRIRFTGTENRPELYRGVKKHAAAFGRGVVLFLVVAALDGWLLQLL